MAAESQIPEFLSNQFMTDVVKINRWDFFVILMVSRVLQIDKASCAVDMNVGKLFETMACATYVTESIH